MRAIRWLIIGYASVFGAIHRTIFRPGFQIAGQCARCGTCCEAIELSLPRFLVPWQCRFVIRVYASINGFVFDHWLDHAHSAVFACPAFDPGTRKCTAYAHRPAVCREYPLKDGPNPPVLFPNCACKVQKF